MTTYRVIIDDNWGLMDNMEALFSGEEPPERYHDANAFETAEEAVERCKEIVRESLAHCYRPGMTGEQLYDAYTTGGDDPFIKPRPPSGRFSAWGYAKALCDKWGATSVPRKR